MKSKAVKTKQTMITKQGDHVTLINIFTVEPNNQQKLIDILVEATDKVMNKLPGFISANIHKSLDGTKVVNYAQWESEMNFNNIFTIPEAREHMEEAYKIAQVDPHLYKVHHIDHV